MPHIQPAGELAFDEFGPSDGLPIVLLHGFPLDRSVLVPMGIALASTGPAAAAAPSDNSVTSRAELSALPGRPHGSPVRTLCLDLPGFGGSPPAGAFSIPDLARYVRRFLLIRGLLPCVLGGLSMGGYVALAYHRLFRADLLALVLIDTKSEADSPEAKANRDRMADIVRREGSEAIARLMLPKMLAAEHADPAHPLARRLLAVMSACPPATIAYALQAMRDRDDTTGDLERTDVPVLVVTGEHDVITPPEQAAAMAGRCRAGRFVSIAGAGHMAPLERPAEVAQAIGSFVTALRGGAP